MCVLNIPKFEMFRKIHKTTRRKPPWLGPFLARLGAVNYQWCFPGNCTKFFTTAFLEYL